MHTISKGWQVVFEDLYCEPFQSSVFWSFLFPFVFAARILDVEHWWDNAHLCLWRYFCMYSRFLSTSQTHLQVSFFLASINFCLKLDHSSKHFWHNNVFGGLSPLPKNMIDLQHISVVNFQCENNIILLTCQMYLWCDALRQWAHFNLAPEKHTK